MKIAFLLILVVALAVVYACGARRRTVVRVDLDGVAEVGLRDDLRMDVRDTEQTGDRTTFVFRRVNDTHLNGQTSYAEVLTLSLLAEDLPVGERFDVEAMVYERHPVKADAWRVRMTDLQAGVELDWMGYQKHYSREKAEAYVREMAASVRWLVDRGRHFAGHRDWGGDWRAVFARNVALLNAELVRLGMVGVEEGRWSRAGHWRYAVDGERPQRFHLVRVIADVTMPDGPFRLTGPLTFFRYYATRGFWHQENQGGGGGLVPGSLVNEFRKELVDEGKVYFYRVQSLHLWKEHGSVREALRGMMREGDARAEEFVKRGAVEGDAEP